MTRPLVLLPPLALACSIALATAERVPTGAVSATPVAAEPPVAGEFCEWVVGGRPPAGTLSLPWHETALPGFREPFTAVAPLASAGEERSVAAARPVDTADAGRALLFAGRTDEAWRELSGLAAEPGSELAFVRAWAAARSGAREAAELLRPFADSGAALACRAPARRAAAMALAAVDDSVGSSRWLAALAGDLPEVPDHVLLWSLEAATLRGRPAEVEALYDSLLSVRPPSALLRTADLARADLYERRGPRDRSASILARLLPRAPRHRRPEILLRLARLEAAAGEPRSSEVRLRQILSEHAESDEALGLVRGWPGKPAPFRALRVTTTERARVLAAHGLVREAVGALTPAATVSELRLRGDIRLRSGDYEMAAADFGEALGLGGDPDELRREMAKAHTRGGDARRALALYRQLEVEAAGGPESADLAYLVADALQESSAEDSSLADSAANRFRALADRFPRSPLAARGLLRLGHLELARGRWSAAASLYRSYLRRYPGREDSREARYWQARALGRAGGRNEERALLAKLLGPGEDDYYEVLARRRLGGDPERAVAELFTAGGPVSVVEAAGERSSGARSSGARTSGAPASVGPSAVAAMDTVIPGGRAAVSLRRARALLLVGESEAAQREVDEAVRLAGGSSAELARVGRWALARGYPESAFRVGWGLFAGGGNEEAATLAFPLAFADLVAFEADEHGVAPGLIWAIMRQESRFDPAARSPAGAMGLLQLIPATARDEAARGGVAEFEPEDLLRPESNLHLGVVHLRALLDDVSGDQAAAAAAYNAGLPQARRWRSLLEASGPEAYIERIPFRETRRYVKQVIANRAAYEALYATP